MFQHKVDIILDDVTEREVLSSLTEENLSEIQFMTDSGAVTGVYRNQLLCGYVDHGDSLEIHINDGDLVRHGLILDENNRILYAVAQRYASEDAVIVDKLPDREYTDYLYIDGEVGVLAPTLLLAQCLQCEFGGVKFHSLVL